MRLGKGDWKLLVSQPTANCNDQLGLTMSAKKTTTKGAARSVGGRPTKYRAAYAEQARKLALLGFTDAKLACFFNVSEQTINNWKREHPGFFESIKSGKEDADARIASAMYHSALGGGIVTEIRKEQDAEGNTVTKTTTRQLPANVTAQIFWLKNRQPHLWRDRVAIEEKAPAETLAERASTYESIMKAARDRQRAILARRGFPESEED